MRLYEDLSPYQFLWCPPSPTGVPQDDLAALLLGVKSSLRRVMEMAPAPTGPGQAVQNPAWQRQRRRLSFDPETMTITLDGKHYRIDDPKVFAVYRAIADRGPDATWIIKADIARKVRAVAGSKTIPCLLNKLPRELRTTVKTSTRGYALHLPDTPARGERRKMDQN